MPRLLVLLAALAAPASVSASDIPFLGDLWNKTDVDNSGALSLTEFSKALEMLGVTVCTTGGCTLFDHDNVSSLFATFDGCTSLGQTMPCSGANQELTLSEIANAITWYPQYEEPLTKVLTNGAGAPPANLLQTLTPSPEMKSSKATVSFFLIVEGPPSDIYSGVRHNIKQWLATNAGVDISSVIITFLRSEARTATARKLAATSTIIDAKIYVADAAAADELAASLPQDPDAMTSLPAFASLTVVEVRKPSGMPRTQPLPFTMMGAAAGVLLIAGIFLCCNAKFWSRRKHRRAGVTTAGCCKTGCCSFYAVKAWAFGEFTAAIAIVACVYWLYTRFQTLTNGIIGLVATVILLVAQGASNVQLSNFTAMIPGAIIDILREQIDQIKLLPLLVMLPGVLAALFLLLSSLCSASTARKGTYCCSKFMMIIATIFLAMSFIFYSVFMIIGIGLILAPPAVMEPINMIQDMCITIPASFNQLVEDNTAAIAQLEKMNQDVSSLTDALNQVIVVTEAIDGGCGHIQTIFQGLAEIFLPGLICVIAIIYAIWVNEMLCCSAGCCKAPPKTDKNNDSKKVSV